ncbi:MAG: alpha/beta hydrolase [Lewinella sp.]|nr:alpha/beta hydrolase [Lewinella sp.]
MKRIINLVIRCTVRPALSPSVPVWLQRACINASSLLQPAPPHRSHERMVSGVDTRVIEPTDIVAGRGVLYLHGGGYVLGGIRSHAKLAAWLGKSVRAKVWLPEYRLAPEEAYPGALQDALLVYATLLAEGQDPQQLILAGDSAGGGLALATATAIRETGLPLPGGIVLFSPWTDLSLSSASVKTHATRDAMLKHDWLRWCAKVYRGTAEVTDPGCSPLFARLEELPPMLIHVGSEEVLLDDTLRLAEYARAAGVSVEQSCFEGVGHVFQFHAGILKEANQSLHQVGEFVERLMQQNIAAVKSRY